MSFIELIDVFYYQLFVCLFVCLVVAFSFAKGCAHQPTCVCTWHSGQVTFLVMGCSGYSGMQVDEYGVV